MKASLFGFSFVIDVAFFQILLSAQYVSAQPPRTGAQKRNRDLQVQTETSQNQWPSRMKRFALVIGVDEYQDPQINRLDGASADAKAIAEALIRYAGFPREQVVLLASDQAVERRPLRGVILRRFSNLRGVVPKDGLLLVAFAGHGIERQGRAYLLPSDAQVGGDVALLEDTAINVENIRDRIRLTGVQQVVMIKNGRFDGTYVRFPRDVQAG
jgi:hypothetical protein